MPEASVITALLSGKELGLGGVLLVIGYFCYAGWFKGSGGTSTYAKTPGVEALIREVQQTVSSGVSDVARRHMMLDERLDKIDERMSRLEMLGEVLKDRTQR